MEPTQGHTAPEPGRFGPLVPYAIASIGAGAIHAAAAATHRDTAASSLVFQVLALAQLGWGAWAMVGANKRIAALGTALSLGAVIGWVVIRSSGIGFIDGFNTPQAVGWPDLLAALLATAVVAGTARFLVADRADGPVPVLRLAGGVLVAVLTLVGVSQSAEPGVASEPGSPDPNELAADFVDDGPVGAGHGNHGKNATVPPVAYNPEASASTSTTPNQAAGGSTDRVRRVDLSGVVGVSPEQQARAEELVEITLDKLPQWADTATAEAKGFHSIGDGFTGHEHYINWSYINDDKILDPDYPESLVYDTTGPTKKLVSAMFMLREGETLETVPDIGGPLTQWHIHDNLCFSSGENPFVSGLTDAEGKCSPPSRKLTPVPMIHVWITANPCGPFSALEGIAAGQVKAGDTQACFAQHSHAGG